MTWLDYVHGRDKDKKVSEMPIPKNSIFYKKYKDLLEGDGDED